MEREYVSLGKQVGLLWTLWRGDALPQLRPIRDFSVITSLLAHLMECQREYVIQILQEEHRPYIAYIGDTPVAVGWSAKNGAEFGHGRVYFHVPGRNRYLYFFITLPEWRGRGIYPHLLQAILCAECVEDERFWIIHELANIASEHGIAKAGFRIASGVYLLGNDKNDTNDENTPLCFVPSHGEIERARAGATVFSLPLIESHANL